MVNRGSGILLHISSLPSRYGIGTFGKEAYRFADFLKNANQKYWQLLPLGPTGFGDSPYQSPSAFAINPYFIDFEILTDQGLLTPQDYCDLDFGNNPSMVDFSKIYLNREIVLRKAVSRQKRTLSEDYQTFFDKNRFWLEDYDLYMAIKRHFDGIEWISWEPGIRLRASDDLALYRERYRDEIEYNQVVQYIAYTQWRSLKKYCNQQGIQIIGDIPIYVASDSADTWSNASDGLFQLNEERTPLNVAGCPPDYFSSNGQYWGNTLYDWDKNKQTGYQWWLERIKKALDMYDWVRIDHFRGFESFWSIPFGSPSAAFGSWRQGPGMDFIHALKREIDYPKIIAEDLGYLTDRAREFIRQSGFPGMKVLEFAFDASEDNEHLPHNYTRNCVAYTATHDNDTIAGWFTKCNQKQFQFAKEYFMLNDKEGYHWGMIRGVLASVADLAILPMQDLLGLGSEARMNTPSTVGGTNWQWRLKPGQITEDLAAKISKLAILYGRI